MVTMKRNISDNLIKKIVNDDIIKVFVSKWLQRNTLKHIVLVSERDK